MSSAEVVAEVGAGEEAEAMECRMVRDSGEFIVIVAAVCARSVCWSRTHIWKRRGAYGNGKPWL